MNRHTDHLPHPGAPNAGTRGTQPATVAVIGAGIAGLSCARALTRGEAPFDVTLFESSATLGGHANTVDVTLDGVTHGVDTGFLVFNRCTYPNFVRLLEELDVPAAPAEMSFSVNLTDLGLVWAGTNLNSVFAQRRNFFRPRFLRMLQEIVRFNRLATGLAAMGDPGALAMPLRAFLGQHRFSQPFRDWYVLPMLGAIWSCSPRQMLDFPTGTLIRFCHNHGLLQIADRPQWYTVAGGSRQYVGKIAAGLRDVRLNTPVTGVMREAAGTVAVRTAAGTEWFDHVVLACHSDQALRLLDDPSEAERSTLSALGYTSNRAVLHTDASLLPRRRAHAAWNYEGQVAAGGDTRMCVHYLLNKLQPLPFTTPLMVSLNPLRAPRPHTVLREFEYAHPLFDLAALEAQARLPRLQGVRNTWFCGAWAGYGFHEDGLRSGLLAAGQLYSQLGQPSGMATQVLPGATPSATVLA